LKIIKQSYEIISEINGEEILEHIERCGRVCYKSEDKISTDSSKRFIQKLIDSGHESVIEHFNFTVLFVCDRGVMAELTRHRLASFSVESTRYCNYGKGKFGGEITVIEPCFWEKGNEKRDTWEALCTAAEAAYLCLIEHGAKPEEARSVLPQSLKTEVVMTANLREWRTILKQRCSKRAHPQMRELMLPLLYELHDDVPVVFDDIYGEYFGGKEDKE
jgi:thymidylate synthase (FAD)